MTSIWLLMRFTLRMPGGSEKWLLIFRLVTTVTTWVWFSAELEESWNFHKSCTIKIQFNCLPLNKSKSSLILLQEALVMASGKVDFSSPVQGWVRKPGFVYRCHPLHWEKPQLHLITLLSNTISITSTQSSTPKLPPTFQQEKKQILRLTNLFLTLKHTETTSKGHYCWRMRKIQSWAPHHRNEIPVSRTYNVSKIFDFNEVFDWPCMACTLWATMWW